MDIEKLIEQLNDFNENHIAVLCGSGQCACGYLCDKDDCIVVRAATALSTLQAENDKLRAELEQVKPVRCKDCKMSRPGGLGYVWCGPTAMPLDGFCSNGQQKED